VFPDSFFYRRRKLEGRRIFLRTDPILPPPSPLTVVTTLFFSSPRPPPSPFGEAFLQFLIQRDSLARAASKQSGCKMVCFPPSLAFPSPSSQKTPPLEGRYKFPFNSRRDEVLRQLTPRSSSLRLGSSLSPLSHIPTSCLAFLFPARRDSGELLVRGRDTDSLAPFFRSSISTLNFFPSFHSDPLTSSPPTGFIRPLHPRNGLSLHRPQFFVYRLVKAFECL